MNPNENINNKQDIEPNFDFIINQQETKNSKKINKKIIFLIILIVITLIMFVVLFLFSKNENNSQKLNQPREIVNNYFDYLKQKNYTEAYKLLELSVEKPNKLDSYTSSMGPLLTDTYNFELCEQGEIEENNQGYKIQATCSAIIDNANVKLVIEIVNINNELKISKISESSGEN